jgi:hypothetical protein
MQSYRPCSLVFGGEPLSNSDFTLKALRMRLTAVSFWRATAAAIFLLVLPGYWEFAERSTPHPLVVG